MLRKNSNTKYPDTRKDGTPHPKAGQKILTSEVNDRYNEFTKFADAEFKRLEKNLKNAQNTERAELMGSGAGIGPEDVKPREEWTAADNWKDTLETQDRTLEAAKEARRLAHEANDQAANVLEQQEQNTQQMKNIGKE